MENTYTYTARSAEDPKRVVTFTLHNHSMSVGITTSLEQVERALDSEDGEIGSEDAPQPYPWLKPAAVSLLQGRMQPFRIADIDASLEDERFQTTAWTRAAGLRLAPIRFTVDPVDNPQAAQAFVQELDKRKREASDLSRFPGPLDYWASWFGASLLVATLTAISAIIWRRIRGGEA
jgi:hypothetical protein